VTTDEDRVIRGVWREVLVTIIYNTHKIYVTVPNGLRWTKIQPQLRPICSQSFKRCAWTMVLSV